MSRKAISRRAFLHSAVLASAATTLAGGSFYSPTPKPSPMKRVLLLGDSIRLGYEPFVRELLTDKAHVLAPIENCQHTVHHLMNFWNWVAPVQPDIIHLNAGLWDTRRVTPGGPDNIIPVEIYARNVRRLVELIREHTRARLLWATTTPVNMADYVRGNAQRGNAGRHGPDIATYNSAALDIMRELHVPVNDLHDYVVRTGPATLLADDGIHYTPIGYAKLAAEVAQALQAALAA